MLKKFKQVVNETNKTVPLLYGEEDSFDCGYKRAKNDVWWTVRQEIGLNGIKEFTDEIVLLNIARHTEEGHKDIISTIKTKIKLLKEIFEISDEDFKTWMSPEQEQELKDKNKQNNLFKTEYKNVIQGLVCRCCGALLEDTEIIENDENFTRWKCKKCNKTSSC